MSPSSSAQDAGRARRGPVTISDVAAHAGASPATVSYALTQPDRLSPEMLARVQKSIEALGYVRNDAARRLRAGRSQAIGLIVPDATNPVFSEIAAAAEQEASRRGTFILIGNSANDAQRERDYIQFFAAQHVRALIIAPVDTVPAALDELTRDAIPFVIIGRASTPHAYSSVSGNDEHGGYIAAEHLLAQGRRKLLFVGGPHDNVTSRFRGFKAAVDAHPGATADFHRVEEQSVAEGERFAAALALERSGIDGVAAGNDLLAIGMLHDFSRSGVDVPREISLIGYDDIDFAKYAIKPISSIRHPLHDLGEEAIRLALGERTKNVEFEPHLVARATSLPVEG